MAFSNSFTGKESAVKLEGGGTQAQQGLNQMVIAAEELRYKVYEKNRNEFLQNANIDPVFVLSDSARKTQMGMITDFNKKWGKRAQETNYNFSEEDRQNMLTEKNYIVSTTQEQLATMDRFKQHRALVQQHPDKFDTVKFNEATDEYMKTGRYDQTVPAWQPIDFGAYARDKAQKQAFVFNEKEINIGKGMEATNAWNMPEGTEGRFLVGLLGNNPQADADFWNRWGKADKKYWFEQADRNKDNKFSPEEQKNAIALWAMNEFADVRMSKQTNKRSISGGGRVATNAAQSSNVGGAPTKIYPGKQTPNQPKTYGDQEYSKTQSFSFGGNSVIYGIPTRGGKAINSIWTDEDMAKGSINGRLVLYDPVKKIFLIESTTSSESADQKSRTLLEIPEENILDFGNIPIEYIGNKTTIAEYKKLMESPAPTETAQPTSTIESNWEQYKRK